MADDPVTWLANHKAAGIVIREDCRPLRTDAEVALWDKRQLQWADELRSGIKARRARDTARVEILDKVTPQILPAGHPWAEQPGSGMTVSSTGVDCLGNNPFSCHCARIERAQEIEREWRLATPRRRDYKVSVPIVFEEIIQREPLRFERGELRRLAKQVAGRVGCNTNTAEKLIRPHYDALKES